MVKHYIVDFIMSAADRRDQEPSLAGTTAPIMSISRRRRHLPRVSAGRADCLRRDTAARAIIVGHVAARIVMSVMPWADRAGRNAADIASAVNLLS